MEEEEEEFLLDKYSLQFEQIKLSIWTNAICNSERCGVQQRRGEERLWRKKRWNSEEEKAARDELKRRAEKVKVIGGQMNGSLSWNRKQKKHDGGVRKIEKGVKNQI